jgi:putative heme iron utilization protein
VADKPSPLRETDEAARRLARILLRSARYAAIAVLDPLNSGFPSVSRVLVGTDIDGVPVILVSTLSAHTKALTNDSRASLLVGEPGKGDPLAHPRLSVQCLARPVAHDDPVHMRLRDRFLERHPKSRLYIDFADFRFFRLEPQGASLNGGFGKAYVLPGNDLVIMSHANESIAINEKLIVQDLLGSYPNLASVLAGGKTAGPKQNWRIYGVDAAGFDMNSGDKLFRYEFEHPANNQNDIKLNITNIVMPVP